jgi:hypothetical protein
MKIESDPLFEAAVNFLENGGELPVDGSTPRQRFIFQAAVMRKLYQVAKNADGKATEAFDAAAATRTYVDTLKDRIDQRTGLLAGSAVIGSGIVGGILLVGKAFGLF